MQTDRRWQNSIIAHGRLVSLGKLFFYSRLPNLKVFIAPKQVTKTALRRKHQAPSASLMKLQPRYFALPQIPRTDQSQANRHPEVTVLGSREGEDRSLRACCFWLPRRPCQQALILRISEFLS